MLVFLYRSQDMGEARYCSSLEHLLGFPGESSRSDIPYETQEKNVFEAFFPEVGRDEGGGA